MKTTSRVFICIAMMAFTLTSCNDIGLANGGDDNPAKKGDTTQPPNENYPIIIKPDVQKWMNEQLASKGSEKRRIHISDMYLSTNDQKAPNLSGTIDSKGNVKYFLNDKEISVEEYNRLYEEKQALSCKRNLDIPGEIYSSPENCRSWMVLMTAKELAELLSKKYDNLAICFEQDEQEL